MKRRFITRSILIIGFIGLVIGFSGFLLSGWRIHYHRFKDIQYITDPNGKLRLVGSVAKPKMAKKSNILILHGSLKFGRKLPLYRMLIGRLARSGYEVASFDFRGYGESDDPHVMAINEFDLRKDISLITKKLEWKEFHLLGHSLGASIAMNAVASGNVDGVLSVISIGPSRRVYERMLRPNADEYEYIRKRFQEDMALGLELEDNLLRFLVENINIDNALKYFKSTNHCPLFLIDGALEDESDLDYLRNYYYQIASPKKYYTIPSSNHRCNMKGFFTSNRINMPKNWDIIIYKKQVFDDLFNQILTWLDKVY